jgi:hypothetical protein
MTQQCTSLSRLLLLLLLLLLLHLVDHHDSDAVKPTNAAVKDVNKLHERAKQNVKDAVASSNAAACIHTNAGTCILQVLTHAFTHNTRAHTNAHAQPSPAAAAAATQ